MTHVTAGLPIRQEGNVQYLNGKLARAAKCETLWPPRACQAEQLVLLETWRQSAWANGSSSACGGLDRRWREREWVSVVRGCAQETEICRGKKTKARAEQ